MERLHVHVFRDLIHQLRSGAIQQTIARDFGLVRTISICGVVPAVIVGSVGVLGLISSVR
ncbi:MAG: hypothetical protein U0821_04350 [Chloroflexota bacterium]